MISLWRLRALGLGGASISAVAMLLLGDMLPPGMLEMVEHVGLSGTSVANDSGAASSSGVWYAAPVAMAGASLMAMTRRFLARALWWLKAIAVVGGGVAVVFAVVVGTRSV